MVFEANRDLRELMGEIVEHTAANGVGRWPRRSSTSCASATASATRRGSSSTPTTSSTSTSPSPSSGARPSVPGWRWSSAASTRSSRTPSSTSAPRRASTTCSRCRSGSCSSGRTAITTEIDVMRGAELLVAMRPRHVCVSTETLGEDGGAADWVREGLERFLRLVGRSARSQAHGQWALSRLSAFTQLALKRRAADPGDHANRTREQPDDRADEGRQMPVRRHGQPRRSSSTTSRTSSR